MITPDDSSNATGQSGPLDREGQRMFDRIAATLDLPIASDRQHIDRFVLRGQLGQGGMGVVHRAFDPNLDREVALKLINVRSFAKLDVLRARLLQEAKVLARLEHANVVRVYEVGEYEGEVYVALELVEGSDLREWQRATSPSREQILRVFVAAGHGLAAAHERGVIHRDFKPDNVLIARDGRVLVGDFGLAGSTAISPAAAELDSRPSGRLTALGELVGTLGYMSPEQLRGDDFDARSDQYAFCVSLWELLTGKPPFLVETRAGLLAAMSEGTPSGGRSLPRWLRAVLLRGLALDPERRFPSMPELIDRLEHGLGRKRRGRLGAGFGLAAAVTITSVTIAVLREPEPACPLEDSLAELRGSEDWQALVDQLDRAGHGTALTRLDAKLEHRVAKLCPSSRDAAKQQLELWFDALALIARSADGRSTDELLTDIAVVGKADFDRPPPEPIPSEVAEQLLLSEQAEREDRLVDALGHADQALELAESEDNPAARALALLRRGRVQAQRDHNQPALADFEQARRAAYEAHYPDALLRADLLSAGVQLKRLDQWAQGESSLLDAHAQLLGLREPFYSPRWTHYHELDAILNVHRGELDEALSDRRRALLLRLIDFDRQEFSLGLVRLGNTHELARRIGHAEVCYRLTLRLVPEPSPTRHHAELALGRILVFEGPEQMSPEQIAEGRALLSAVIEADAGSRVEAMYSLLALAYRLHDSAEAGRIADDLGKLLPHDPTVTPRRRFEALLFIAISQAERSLDYGPTRDQADQLARDQPDGEVTLAYFDLQMLATLGFEHGSAFEDRLDARLPELPERQRLEILAALDDLRQPDDSQPPS